jgi:putative IMPACT (imprinted ancient) family translation regulator
VKHLIHKHNGLIRDETFLQSVALFVEFREDDIADFSRHVQDATSGQVLPIALSDE